MDTDRLLLVLQEADKPLSTNQVADQLGVDWHTANKHLNRLVDEGAVHRSDISDRLTLYSDQDLPF